MAIFRHNIEEVAKGTIFVNIGASIADSIFRQRPPIWDIWSDMEEGVIASIAATFTTNICAEVKSLEKPNISIDVLVNKVTRISGSSTNCPVAIILPQ